ncbi:glycosyltransferase family 2 protein, partial [Mesonia sp.]|uniref:glycosyltransferase family 2 protein n=1 Tax=Mesonia sp. TaxID=1960830 RepID=UPI003F9758E6
MALASFQSRFQLYKAVVIIPTYNNELTLTRVIDDVLRFTSNVIIVNDGSTDNTATLLKDYDFLTQIHLPKNKGKGFALRQAFHKGEELGYHYGITIDSDGQHFADDLPVFLEELEKEPEKEILIIGSRTMTGPEIPSKSSFGNKFSNFWFWIETGIKLTDTQCGYRLYPLKQMNQMYLFTNKFEFEIEA